MILRRLAFVLLGVVGFASLACDSILEDERRVYWPEERDVAAGDTIRVGGSWKEFCRQTKPKIGSGTSECPPVPFRSEIACSRPGCLATMIDDAADGADGWAVTVPDEPGPVELTFTMRRNGADDEVHSESFEIEVHRMSGVTVDCLAAGCAADWADAIANGGAVRVSVSARSSADGSTIFPSFKARIEPETGEAVDLVPITCTRGRRCVVVSKDTPGTLDISGPGFTRRVSFRRDGTVHEQ